MSEPSVNLHKVERVILFDGVCKLCHAWVRFILRFDRNEKVKLCAAQSKTGQALLKQFNYPIQDFESMLYFENKQCFEKSDAYFKIMSTLGFPWKVLLIFRLIPRPVSDWFYDLVARNRYRLFGKYDQCIVPNPEQKTRFIDD